MMNNLSFTDILPNMGSNEIRNKYLSFYEKRGHKIIHSSPIVPVNDPTTLFTSSGMQPLVPYLLGQKHPLGKRLVDIQKSFRAGDIGEVGDNRHTTFFEMLGNWSLGDYFKKEQLPWIFEYFTDILGLDPKRLFVTVFDGSSEVPQDTESISIWKEIFNGVGIKAVLGERIFAYPAKKNWWSRSGEPKDMPTNEIGGPDSEIFYDFGEKLHLHEKSPYRNEKCHPNCDCGRFMEIGNSVFMQYQKQANGKLKELSQRNVDFGGGLERINAAVNNTPDIFATDSFTPITKILASFAKVSYGENLEETRAMRIVADHLRAAIMMMSESVVPNNKAQGYIVRRLIRRSVLYGKKLGLWSDWSYLDEIVSSVANMFGDEYPEVMEHKIETQQLLREEAIRFGKTIDIGLKEIQKMSTINGKDAFRIYESYGFPLELTEEIASERGFNINKKQFEEEFKRHQNVSRTAAKGMFKGGLSDHSEETTKLHTAHHLLLAALQKTVNMSIRQRGSNITGERLRMDFNFDQKITPGELEKISDLVNKKIQEDLPIMQVEMPINKAQKIGAQMEFGQKYPERVSVYFIGLKKDIDPETANPGDYYSAEFCGGPHAKTTGSLGHFSIIKEESAGSGVRRIYAKLG